MSHDSLQSRVVHDDLAVHHGGLRARAATMIIMHASESNDSAQGTINYLNTTTERVASYHYLIDRDGTIVRMCDPSVIAYHAGDSAWPNPKRARSEDDKPNGGQSVNAVSIGIAWENNGRNTGEPLTDAQMESALWLAAQFVGDGKIPVERVRGHNEVSPGRKVDPGPACDMDEFRAQLTAYLEDA